MIVTVKPTLPAQLLYCASCSLFGGIEILEKDSTADRSSKFHVLPMLKLPLLFSLALCILTLPVDLTAMITSLGFLVSGLLSGGGGVEGYCPSSCIRICVMYDSASCPLWSVLEKQDSIILLFSSSKRSALDICPTRVCEFMAAGLLAIDRPVGAAEVLLALR